MKKLAIHAVLVGIENYPSKRPRGCTNDVKAVVTYLKTTNYR